MTPKVHICGEGHKVKVDHLWSQKFRGSKIDSEPIRDLYLIPRKKEHSFSRLPLRELITIKPPTHTQLWRKEGLPSDQPKVDNLHLMASVIHTKDILRL